MNGYAIHIEGIVQGVGFRPFIYGLARSYGFKGYVTNSGLGVSIMISQAQEQQINEFIEDIRLKAPDRSEIEKITRFESQPSVNSDFSIRMTETGQDNRMPLTPDFALCPVCINDMNNPTGRRHQYAFTTCTHCGPRYSIINRMPYDRPYTTMASFIMCPECEKEYHDPLDRRFYSQTNSCPNCRVTMTLFNSKRNKLDVPQEDIPARISELLKQGNIIAIKGIGGYLLLSDATQALTIDRLRQRKRRPAKPFALMYPDFESALQDVEVDEQVKMAWRSPECPIVLCPVKERPSSGIKLDLIAPGLDQLGIMMPYTPLFHLILKHFQRPVIATSGNLSDAPIIYQNDEALQELTSFSDYVLINDRDIIVPQDDSVVRFSEENKIRIVIRRSRGMAPGFPVPDNRIQQKILCMGAMLKSAFALVNHSRIYISQYLGNASSLDAQRCYERVLNHLIQVMSYTPELICVDKHPDYPTTDLGMEMAVSYRIPVFKVQHHRAHAFAVLGENAMLQSEGVMVAVWDGTGWGDDSRIWGGEFFAYNGKELDRIGHGEYFPHILGDKMAREPRISAFALSRGDKFFRERFTEEEWNNYHVLIQNHSLETSSMGRVFDAVACLLNLSDRSSYEGEAAMYVERLAHTYRKQHLHYWEHYVVEWTENRIFSYSSIFSGMIRDLQGGLSTAEIALKFHISLVEVLILITEQSGLNKLAFSGGVFQNALLVDLIAGSLGKRYPLYFHRQLSPNDECIAYGQLIACLHEKNSLL